MLEVSRNLPPAGALYTQEVGAATRHLEAGKDSLSSSSSEPGCLESIWRGVIGFFEAAYNFIKFILCCGYKSPLPKPFPFGCELPISENVKKISQDAYAKCNFKDVIVECSLSYFLASVESIAACFAESKKIDSDMQQIAFVTMKIESRDFRIYLTPGNKEESLCQMAEAYVNFLNKISPKPEIFSISFVAEYLRLGGIRSETFKCEKDFVLKESSGELFRESTANYHTSNPRAWTRRGALDVFICEFNRLTELGYKSHQLFDSKGHLKSDLPL